MPMFYNETWVPLSLDELTDGESIRVDDVEGFIPFMTERWPEGGKPDRFEACKQGARGPLPNPKGVSGWLVFRLPPKEREIDPEAPVINWDAIRAERIRDRKLTDTAESE